MLSNEKKKPDNSIGDYKSFLHPLSSIQPLTRSKHKTDDMNESPLLFYITQCRSKSKLAEITDIQNHQVVSSEELRVRNSSNEELSTPNGQFATRSCDQDCDLSLMVCYDYDPLKKMHFGVRCLDQ
ncbi:PREDICTED: uncharacterized protein LOC106305345 isoform X2 [Brassica oleracea var. oleracea]|uniref:uncharacterized protein LOC106305345 isoform X2 n=1 Tax=Brassica oleracea var. oleracea TaxID=109376 RepID=UPI0006A746AA|nr:PREDICTED: uncharacterized protein LOC106305345 isoform X2 [Brassica oleracea var. oleracea]